MGCDHKGLIRWLYVLVAFFMGCGQGSSPEADDGATGRVPLALEGGSTPTVAEPRTISLQLPLGAAPEDVVASGTTSLELKDRVELRPGAGTALATSATGSVVVGNEADVDSVISGANVLMHHRSSALGSVLASGTITKESEVTILGEETQGYTTTPNGQFSWNIVIPPPFQGEQHLEPDTVQVLEPSSYAGLTIKSRAKAYLSSGDYFFTTLSLEPQAELVLDDRAGPVVLYVRDAFAHKGVIRSTQQADPQLLVVYLGTNTVFVEAPFIGTIVAPDATLRIQAAQPAGHTGAFFAKELSAEPDTIIRHQSFDWSSLDGFSDGSDPGPLPTLEVAGMPPSPISILSKGVDGAIQTLDEPVDFTLPERIPVTTGNAGIGLLNLRYVTTGGDAVVCTYTGGADELYPDTLLEFVKGLFYHFQSCSDGGVAGDTVTATEVEVSQTGDPGFLDGTVEVELGLGDGCSELLEPPITAVESRQLIESFNWNDEPTLAEVDAETGLPALYYMLIYVRTEKERRLLDTFRIHYQTKPLFNSEYAKYEDKCGTIRYEGDGEGHFLFAVIPGKIYNRIKAAYTNDDIPPEDREIFRAIIPRSAPAEAVNANGSLRYDVLMDYGFYYRNRREEPPSQISDDLVQGASSAPSFTLNAIDFVFQVVNEAADFAQKGLGVIDRFIHGTVRMRVDLNVLNRDLFFPGHVAMQRGWGTRAGRELAPTVKTQIYTLSASAVTGALALAQLHEGWTNADGHSSIPVPKDSAVHQSLPRAFCIPLENDAARITSDIETNEFCNFKATRLNDMFGGFNNDRDVPVNTDDADLHALAEMEDVNDYMHDVTGTQVRQALVMTGHTAGVLGYGGKLWAPCQNYPTLTTEVYAWAAAGLGAPFLALLGPGSAAAAYYLAQLDRTDIVMPRSSHKFSRSRGVMSHEYGHFVFCHFMNELGLMDQMTLDTVWEGMGEVESNDETRIMNEAFADFIMSQVSGGVDYWTPRDTIFNQDWHDADGDFLPDRDYDSFCFHGIGADPLGRGLGCVEQNVHEQGSGGEKIARMVSLLTDVFDGSAKGTLGPTNGDLFDLVPPRAPDQACAFNAPLFYPTVTGHCLEYTPDTYANEADEPVSLLGFDIDTMFRNFDTVRESDSIDVSSFSKALAASMYNRGHNWCDVCSVFAPHTVQTEVDSDGAVCSGNAQFCSGSPFVSCDDRQDPGNCGACGINCFPVQQCFAGSCVSGCPAGTTNCDRSCADLQTNELHCGQCGNRCFRGQTCIGGQCTSGPAYTRQLWRACLDNPEVAAIVGAFGDEPPEPSLRMNAEDCTPCPPGSISLDNGECSPCPPNTFVVGNSCGSCDLNTQVDHEGACCWHDLTVDLTTRNNDELYCNPVTLPAGSASESSCGLEVLRVQELGTYLNSGTPGQVEFTVQPPSAASCVGVTYELQLRQSNGATWVPTATRIGTGLSYEPVAGCTFDFPMMLAVTTDQIAMGLTEVVATVRALPPSSPGLSVLRMKGEFDFWDCAE